LKVPCVGHRVANSTPPAGSPFGAAGGGDWQPLWCGGRRGLRANVFNSACRRLAYTESDAEGTESDTIILWDTESDAAGTRAVVPVVAVPPNLGVPIRGLSQFEGCTQCPAVCSGRVQQGGRPRGGRRRLPGPGRVQQRHLTVSGRVQQRHLPAWIRPAAAAIRRPSGRAPDSRLRRTEWLQSLEPATEAIRRLSGPFEGRALC
jgi:hypothetical protein